MVRPMAPGSEPKRRAHSAKAVQLFRFAGAREQRGERLECHQLLAPAADAEGQDGGRHEGRGPVAPEQAQQLTGAHSRSDGGSWPPVGRPPPQLRIE